MSRTRKRATGSSPIKKYVTFSGSTGTLSYWDKEAEERVEFESLDFVVLDVRSSITGFSEANHGMFSSNMVLDTTKDELEVVCYADKKSLPIAKGLYKEIKDQLKAVNAKFTSNVLCLADFGEGYEMTNLQLSGAALNGWIDFVAKHPNNSYFDNLITITKGALCKRGGKDGNVPVTAEEEAKLDALLKKNPRAPKPVWFYVVELSTGQLAQDLADMAEEQDENLQAYFNSLKSAKTEDIEVEAEEVTAPASTRQPRKAAVAKEEEDDLPF